VRVRLCTYIRAATDNRGENEPCFFGHYENKCTFLSNPPTNMFVSHHVTTYYECGTTVDATCTLNVRRVRTLMTNQIVYNVRRIDLDGLVML